MKQDGQSTDGEKLKKDSNQITSGDSIKRPSLSSPEPRKKEATKQSSQPSFFQKNKKWIITLVLILTIIFIILGVFLRLVKQEQNEAASNTDLTSVPTQKHSSDKEKHLVEVEYIDREKVLDTVKLERNSETEATSAEDWELDIYHFYKVGTVMSGKYKNGELLLALFKAGGPCKGASCDKPVRLRYIKKGDVVTFLPRISYPDVQLFRSPVSNNQADDLMINPFKKYGLTLKVDDNFTIPVLEYPEEIQGPNQRQILKAPNYLIEEDGEIDSTRLYKVFTHSVFGDIYTTRAEFSPSISFKPEVQGGAFGSGSGVDGCRNTGCFTTNQFYAFRPDNTFIKFSYEPDISVDDIAWTDDKVTCKLYIPKTVAGCSLQKLDDISVVAPSLVKETDLVEVGKVNSSGDVVYGLKDQDHKFYTEFYNTYKEYYAGPYIYSDKELQTKSFEEFINSRPLFLWRDPFGRLIRFNNAEFLPSFSCEPIIYLYPEEEREIKLKFGEKVNIINSTPEYRNGWNVLANSSGKITNLSEKRTYPYLFWEGYSYIFPMRKEGFVVRREEVPEFFEDILPKLGLNKKEADDFRASWLPHFSDSPYYLITFIDKKLIDKIAPLEISPKPDSVIRILMDYQPLEKPVAIPEPKLPEPSLREGFVVVEWGGLMRGF